MSYRSDRFNDRMKSLETMLSGYHDISKARILCDGGAALEQMLDALDYSPERERQLEEARAAALLEQRKNRLAKLAAAIARLVAAEKPHLIPTLLLIVRNGKDCEKSQEIIPERSYRRHRQELCRFFGVKL